MFDIEILSALRRAGFPLTRIDEIFKRFKVEPDTILQSQVPEMFPNAQPIAGHWYLEPTIEQLFKTLGKSFQLLEQTDIWGAIGRRNGEQKLAVADTPQESLAKLFIELKKK